MVFRRILAPDPAYPGSVAPRLRGLRADPSSDVAALINRQFQAFDPNRASQVDVYTAILKPLEDRLIALQQGGNPMPCSEQLFIEAKWLLHYTCDWPRLDLKLTQFAASLDDPDQGFAVRQSPVDGAWGGCYAEWFLKLDASLDGLNQLADEGRDAAYPLVFLDPVSSPEAIVATLDPLKVSDILRTGRDRRDALGSVTTMLSEIFFKSHLRKCIADHTRGYTITDVMVSAYRAYQDAWQDPETGYWGAWYKDGDRVVKSADLSFTFHTVSYRKGDVNHWDRLFDTTLAIRDQGYPFGWMSGGHYENHNNYDVVKIFRYGWPQATPARKERASAAIGELLDWCLTDSLQPDGSFKVDPDFFSSVSDAFYYGVSFLSEVGYWDTSLRFWTTRDFPDAQAIACKIKGKLASLHLKDESAQAAMQILEAACPSG